MDRKTAFSSISIDEACNGMVLHDDAVGRAGQVLLPAGATLTERHLQLLNANGVTSLSIRTAAIEADETKKTLLSPAEIDSALTNRFRDNDPEHPIIKELARICRARMEAKK